ncbi:sugar ABC transporter permease [Alicyclobacillaceae bacterium I2511]|nr:sugar ABC transporter permease [Alicyclobacillaceae bacterium I2511]
MAPALFFLTLFVFVPIIYVVYLSFYKSNLLSPHPTFVWLQNYVDLFHSENFLQAFHNSVFLGVGMLLLSLPLGLVFASLLNMKLQGSQVYRTLLFSPYVMPLVGSGLVFTLLFNTDDGLVNHMLTALSLPAVNWLGSSHTALFSILVLSVWQYTGYYMLIFLAGLQNVPQPLVEASQVDGAGRGQTFLHVTLPALSPSLFFAMVVCLIQSFQVFDQVYVMTGGGPDGASTTLTYYIFEKGFQMFQMGPAAAASVFLLVVLAVLSLLQVYISRRWVVDES